MVDPSVCKRVKGQIARRSWGWRNALSLAVAFAALALVVPGCSTSGTREPPRSSSSQAPTSTSTAKATSGSQAGTAIGSERNIYAHILPADLSAAVKDVPTRVYVPNSESDTVDVIDPATFKVIDHFAVGHQPQHVTPSWDLKTLYVNDNASNDLIPIDPRTGKPGAKIPVEDPYNLYFTPDGTKAIVVAERLQRMDFRDPRTWQLIKSVPVAHAGVDHMDFSADGRYLIASCEFSGWLVRVDLATMAVSGELDVGGMPVDVKLSPDGSVFYVANQHHGGVSIIDGNAMRQVGFIPTGNGAHGLYASRDTRSLYVSNRLAGSVSVIDFATRKVSATWPVGGSPDMGGVSSDGSQLWLSGRYHAEAMAIDTRTGARIATIKVGRGPHGLAIFPQPGRYSLGHTGVFR